MLQYCTQFTVYLVLLVFCAAILAAIQIYRSPNTRKTNRNEPPSPRFKLPIIGHLHLLTGYQVPYQAFTKLSRKFGSVITLQMGSVKCVVVNGQKNIREALVTKGHHFDSRPNFQRYQQLFCGNKENSLAFCNWSETQKTRRDMLKAYTFPRAFTNKFYSLEQLISEGVDKITSHLDCHRNEMTAVKPIIMKTCANIFTAHFCSKQFDFDDAKFARLIDNYDDIFYEVNQGYAADFLPFLMPLHSGNLRRVNGLTHDIRQFVLDEIIQDRYENYKSERDPDDYVDSLVKTVKYDGELSWDSALYALEDIIGGHSAVGNFLIKLLAFLAKEPQVQERIKNEIDQVVGERPITISDRGLLPYTEASIFEAIRLIASPIVPRVANRDSSIDGFDIDKGTVIFLNNYDLSMSADLWTEPELFKPERFIREGRFHKPEHFLPFGGGRRSCMGYKMVQLVSFGLVGGLVQNNRITPSNYDYQVPVGSLALPKDTFQFKFTRR